MVIKEIIQIGNPILRKRTSTVSKINSKNIQNIVKNLIDTMHSRSLVGIAAPQIGESIKIFITEITETEYRKVDKIDKTRVYINPKITWFSKKEVVIFEGCGSVAYGKIFGPVKRPEKIVIEACDISGNKFILKADGLLSRVIQHEHDHLQGIDFMEKVTDMRKIMSVDEYRKRIALK